MDPLEQINEIYKTSLTESEFQKLSQYIYSNYGIKMPHEKKIMLQSRLHKRLRALGMSTFKEYLDYLFSKEGQRVELYHMIDAVSTNKTDFFREPQHFDYLSSTLLPELYARAKGYLHLKVWSAACSSGEEVYTLAIVLNEFALRYPSVSFTVVGSDISTQMLEKAVMAVYTEDRIDCIPNELKRKYFLKSKDREKRTVRVVPALRATTSFARVNLMDTSYGMNTSFDIVFCRNVLIYFDRLTQEQVITKLARSLKPGGFFFLGHSESITNMQVPLKQVRPTIYTTL